MTEEDKEGPLSFKGQMAARYKERLSMGFTLGTSFLEVHQTELNPAEPHTAEERAASQEAITELQDNRSDLVTTRWSKSSLGEHATDIERTAANNGVTTLAGRSVTSTQTTHATDLEQTAANNGVTTLAGRSVTSTQTTHATDLEQTAANNGVTTLEGRSVISTQTTHSKTMVAESCSVSGNEVGNDSVGIRVESSHDLQVSGVSRTNSKPEVRATLSRFNNAKTSETSVITSKTSRDQQNREDRNSSILEFDKNSTGECDKCQNKEGSVATNTSKDCPQFDSHSRMTQQSSGDFKGDTFRATNTDTPSLSKLTQQSSGDLKGDNFREVHTYTPSQFSSNLGKTSESPETSIKDKNVSVPKQELSNVSSTIPPPPLRINLRTHAVRRKVDRDHLHAARKKEPGKDVPAKKPVPRVFGSVLREKSGEETRQKLTRIKEKMLKSMNESQRKNVVAPDKGKEASPVSVTRQKIDVKTWRRQRLDKDDAKVSPEKKRAAVLEKYLQFLKASNSPLPQVSPNSLTKEMWKASRPPTPHTSSHTRRGSHASSKASLHNAKVTTKCVTDLVTTTTHPEDLMPEKQISHTGTQADPTSNVQTASKPSSKENGTDSTSTADLVWNLPASSSNSINSSSWGDNKMTSPGSKISPASKKKLEKLEQTVYKFPRSTKKFSATNSQISDKSMSMVQDGLPEEPPKTKTKKRDDSSTRFKSFRSSTHTTQENAQEKEQEKLLLPQASSPKKCTTSNVPHQSAAPKHEISNLLHQEEPSKHPTPILPHPTESPKYPSPNLPHPTEPAKHLTSNLPHPTEPAKHQTSKESPNLSARKESTFSHETKNKWPHILATTVLADHELITDCLKDLRVHNSSGSLTALFSSSNDSEFCGGLPKNKNLAPEPLKITELPETGESSTDEPALIDTLKTQYLARKKPCPKMNYKIHGASFSPRNVVQADCIRYLLTHRLMEIPGVLHGSPSAAVPTEDMEVDSNMRSASPGNQKYSVIHGLSPQVIRLETPRHIPSAIMTSSHAELVDATSKKWTNDSQPTQPGESVARSGDAKQKQANCATPLAQPANNGDKSLSQTISDKVEKMPSESPIKKKRKIDKNKKVKKKKKRKKKEDGGSEMTVVDGTHSVQKLTKEKRTNKKKGSDTTQIHKEITEVVQKPDVPETTEKLDQADKVDKADKDVRLERLGSVVVRREKLKKLLARKAEKRETSDISKASIDSPKPKKKDITAPSRPVSQMLHLQDIKPLACGDSPGVAQGREIVSVESKVCMTPRDMEAGRMSRLMSQPTDKLPLRSRIPQLSSMPVTPRKKLDRLVQYRRWREAMLDCLHPSKLPLTESFRQSLDSAVMEEWALHCWHQSRDSEEPQTFWLSRDYQIQAEIMRNGYSGYVDGGHIEVGREQCLQAVTEQIHLMLCSVDVTLACRKRVVKCTLMSTLRWRRAGNCVCCLRYCWENSRRSVNVHIVDFSFCCMKVIVECWWTSCRRCVVISMVDFSLYSIKTAVSFWWESCRNCVNIIIVDFALCRRKIIVEHWWKSYNHSVNIIIVDFALCRRKIIVEHWWKSYNHSVNIIIVDFALCRRKIIVEHWWKSYNHSVNIIIVDFALCRRKIIVEHWWKSYNHSVNIIIVDFALCRRKIIVEHWWKSYNHSVNIITVDFALCRRKIIVARSCCCREYCIKISMGDFSLCNRTTVVENRWKSYRNCGNISTVDSSLYSIKTIVECWWICCRQNNNMNCMDFSCLHCIIIRLVNLSLCSGRTISKCWWESCLQNIEINCVDFYSLGNSKIAMEWALCFRHASFTICPLFTSSQKSAEQFVYLIHIVQPHKGGAFNIEGYTGQDFGDLLYLACKDLSVSVPAAGFKEQGVKDFLHLICPPVSSAGYKKRDAKGLLHLIFQSVPLIVETAGYNEQEMRDLIQLIYQLVSLRMQAAENGQTKIFFGGILLVYTAATINSTCPFDSLETVGALLCHTFDYLTAAHMFHICPFENQHVVRVMLSDRSSCGYLTQAGIRLKCLFDSTVSMRYMSSYCTSCDELTETWPCLMCPFDNLETMRLILTDYAPWSYLIQTWISVMFSCDGMVTGKIYHSASTGNAEIVHTCQILNFTNFVSRTENCNNNSNTATSVEGDIDETIKCDALTMSALYSKRAHPQRQVRFAQMCKEWPTEDKFWRVSSSLCIRKVYKWKTVHQRGRLMKERLKIWFSLGSMLDMLDLVRVTSSLAGRTKCGIGMVSATNWLSSGRVCASEDTSMGRDMWHCWDGTSLGKEIGHYSENTFIGNKIGQNTSIDKEIGHYYENAFFGKEIGHCSENTPFGKEIGHYSQNKSIGKEIGHYSEDTSMSKDSDHCSGASATVSPYNRSCVLEDNPQYRQHPLEQQISHSCDGRFTEGVWENEPGFGFLGSGNETENKPSQISYYTYSTIAYDMPGNTVLSAHNSGLASPSKSMLKYGTVQHKVETFNYNKDHNSNYNDGKSQITHNNDKQKATVNQPVGESGLSGSQKQFCEDMGTARLHNNKMAQGTTKNHRFCVNRDMPEMTKRNTPSNKRLVTTDDVYDESLLPKKDRYCVYTINQTTPFAAKQKQHENSFHHLQPRPKRQLPDVDQMLVSSGVPRYQLRMASAASDRRLHMMQDPLQQKALLDHGSQNHDSNFVHKDKLSQASTICSTQGESSIDENKRHSAENSSSKEISVGYDLEEKHSIVVNKNSRHCGGSMNFNPTGKPTQGHISDAVKEETTSRITLTCTSQTKQQQSSHFEKKTNRNPRQGDTGEGRGSFRYFCEDGDTYKAATTWNEDATCSRSLKKSQGRSKLRGLYPDPKVIQEMQKKVEMLVQSYREFLEHEKERQGQEGKAETESTRDTRGSGSRDTVSDFMKPSEIEVTSLTAPVYHVMLDCDGDLGSSTENNQESNECLYSKLLEPSINTADVDGEDSNTDRYRCSNDEAQAIQITGSNCGDVTNKRLNQIKKCRSVVSSSVVQELSTESANAFSRVVNPTTKQSLIPKPNLRWQQTVLPRVATVSIHNNPPSSEGKGIGQEDMPLTQAAGQGSPSSDLMLTCDMHCSAPRCHNLTSVQQERGQPCSVAEDGSQCFTFLIKDKEKCRYNFKKDALLGPKENPADFVKLIKLRDIASSKTKPSRIPVYKASKGKLQAVRGQLDKACGYQHSLGVLSEKENIFSSKKVLADKGGKYNDGPNVEHKKARVAFPAIAAKVRTPVMKQPTKRRQRSQIPVALRHTKELHHNDKERNLQAVSGMTFDLEDIYGLDQFHAAVSPDETWHSRNETSVHLQKDNFTQSPNKILAQPKPTQMIQKLSRNFTPGKQHDVKIADSCSQPFRYTAAQSMNITGRPTKPKHTSQNGIKCSGMFQKSNVDTHMSKSKLSPGVAAKQGGRQTDLKLKKEGYNPWNRFQCGHVMQKSEHDRSIGKPRISVKKNIENASRQPFQFKRISTKRENAKGRPDTWMERPSNLRNQYKDTNILRNTVQSKSAWISSLDKNIKNSWHIPKHAASNEDPMHNTDESLHSGSVTFKSIPSVSSTASCLSFLVPSGTSRNSQHPPEQFPGYPAEGRSWMLPTADVPNQNVFGFDSVTSSWCSASAGFEEPPGLPGTNTKDESTNFSGNTSRLKDPQATRSNSDSLYNLSHDKSNGETSSFSTMKNISDLPFTFTSNSGDDISMFLFSDDHQCKCTNTCRNNIQRCVGNRKDLLISNYNSSNRKNWRTASEPNLSATYSSNLSQKVRQSKSVIEIRNGSVIAAEPCMEEGQLIMDQRNKGANFNITTVKSIYIRSDFKRRDSKTLGAEGTNDIKVDRQRPRRVSRQPVKAPGHVTMDAFLSELQSVFQRKNKLNNSCNKSPKEKRFGGSNRIKYSPESLHRNTKRNLVYVCKKILPGAAQALEGKATGFSMKASSGQPCCRETPAQEIHQVDSPRKPSPRALPAFANIVQFWEGINTMFSWRHPEEKPQWNGKSVHSLKQTTSQELESSTEFHSVVDNTTEQGFYSRLADKPPHISQRKDLRKRSVKKCTDPLLIDRMDTQKCCEIISFLDKLINQSRCSRTFWLKEEELQGSIGQLIDMSGNLFRPARTPPVECNHLKMDLSRKGMTTGNIRMEAGTSYAKESSANAQNPIADLLSSTVSKIMRQLSSDDSSISSSHEYKSITESYREDTLPRPTHQPVLVVGRSPSSNSPTAVLQTSTVIPCQPKPQNPPDPRPDATFTKRKSPMLIKGFNQESRRSTLESDAPSVGTSASDLCFVISLGLDYTSDSGSEQPEKKLEDTSHDTSRISTQSQAQQSLDSFAYKTSRHDVLKCEEQASMVCYEQKTKTGHSIENIHNSDAAIFGRTRASKRVACGMIMPIDFLYSGNTQCCLCPSKDSVSSQSLMEESPSTTSTKLAFQNFQLTGLPSSQSSLARARTVDVSEEITTDQVHSSELDKISVSSRCGWQTPQLDNRKTNRRCAKHTQTMLNINNESPARIWLNRRRIKTKTGAVHTLTFPKRTSQVIAENSTTISEKYFVSVKKHKNVVPDEQVSKTKRDAGSTDVKPTNNIVNATKRPANENNTPGEQKGAVLHVNGNCQTGQIDCRTVVVKKMLTFRNNDSTDSSAVRQRQRTVHHKNHRKHVALGKEFTQAAHLPRCKLKICSSPWKHTTFSTGETQSMHGWNVCTPLESIDNKIELTRTTSLSSSEGSSVRKLGQNQQTGDASRFSCDRTEYTVISPPRSVRFLRNQKGLPLNATFDLPRYTLVKDAITVKDRKVASRTGRKVKTTTFSSSKQLLYDGEIIPVHEEHRRHICNRGTTLKKQIECRKPETLKCRLLVGSSPSDKPVSKSTALTQQTKASLSSASKEDLLGPHTRKSRQLLPVEKLNNWGIMTSKSPHSERFTVVPMCKKKSPEEFTIVQACKNKTLEKYPAVSTCKNKTLEEFNLVPVCRNKTLEEFSLVPICRNKTLEEFNLVPICRNKTLEEFNLVPICRNKTLEKYHAVPVYKNKTFDEYDAPACNNKTLEECPAVLLCKNKTSEKYLVVPVWRSKTSEVHSAMPELKNKTLEDDPVVPACKNKTSEEEEVPVKKDFDILYSPLSYSNRPSSSLLCCARWRHCMSPSSPSFTRTERPQKSESPMRKTGTSIYKKQMSEKEALLIKQSSPLQEARRFKAGKDLGNIKLHHFFSELNSPLSTKESNFEKDENHTHKQCSHRKREAKHSKSKAIAQEHGCPHSASFVQLELQPSTKSSGKHCLWSSPSSFKPLKSTGKTDIQKTEASDTGTCTDAEGKKCLWEYPNSVPYSVGSKLPDEDRTHEDMKKPLQRSSEGSSSAKNKFRMRVSTPGSKESMQKYMLVPYSVDNKSHARTPGCKEFPQKYIYVAYSAGNKSQSKAKKHSDHKASPQKHTGGVPCSTRNNSRTETRMHADHKESPQRHSDDPHSEENTLQTVSRAPESKGFLQKYIRIPCSADGMSKTEAMMPGHKKYVYVPCPTTDKLSTEARTPGCRTSLQKNTDGLYSTRNKSQIEVRTAASKESPQKHTDIAYSARSQFQAEVTTQSDLTESLQEYSNVQYCDGEKSQRKPRTPVHRESLQEYSKISCSEENKSQEYKSCKSDPIELKTTSKAVPITYKFYTSDKNGSLRNVSGYKGENPCDGASLHEVKIATCSQNKLVKQTSAPCLSTVSETDKYNSATSIYEMPLPWHVSSRGAACGKTSSGNHITAAGQPNVRINQDSSSTLQDLCLSFSTAADMSRPSATSSSLLSRDIEIVVGNDISMKEFMTYLLRCLQLTSPEKSKDEGRRHLSINSQVPLIIEGIVNGQTAVDDQNINESKAGSQMDKDINKEGEMDRRDVSGDDKHAGDGSQEQKPVASHDLTNIPPTEVNQKVAKDTSKDATKQDEAAKHRTSSGAHQNAGAWPQEGTYTKKAETGRWEAEGAQVKAGASSKRGTVIAEAETAHTQLSGALKNVGCSSHRCTLTMEADRARCETAGANKIDDYRLSTKPLTEINDRIHKHRRNDATKQSDAGRCEDIGEQKTGVISGFSTKPPSETHQIILKHMGKDATKVDTVNKEAETGKCESSVTQKNVDANLQEENPIANGIPFKTLSKVKERIPKHTSYKENKHNLLLPAKQPLRLNQSDSIKVRNIYHRKKNPEAGSDQENKKERVYHTPVSSEVLITKGHSNVCQSKATRTRKKKVSIASSSSTSDADLSRHHRRKATRERLVQCRKRPKKWYNCKFSNIVLKRETMLTQGKDPCVSAPVLNLVDSSTKRMKRHDDPPKFKSRTVRKLSTDDITLSKPRDCHLDKVIKSDNKVTVTVLPDNKGCHPGNAKTRRQSVSALKPLKGLNETLLEKESQMFLHRDTSVGHQVSPSFGHARILDSSNEGCHNKQRSSDGQAGKTSATNSNNGVGTKSRQATEREKQVIAKDCEGKSHAFAVQSANTSERKCVREQKHISSSSTRIVESFPSTTSCSSLSEKLLYSLDHTTLMAAKNSSSWCSDQDLLSRIFSRNLRKYQLEKNKCCLSVSDKDDEEAAELMAKIRKVKPHKSQRSSALASGIFDQSKKTKQIMKLVRKALSEKRQGHTQVAASGDTAETGHKRCVFKETESHTAGPDCPENCKLPDRYLTSLDTRKNLLEASRKSFKETSSKDFKVCHLTDRITDDIVNSPNMTMGSKTFPYIIYASNKEPYLGQRNEKTYFQVNELDSGCTAAVEQLRSMQTSIKHEKYGEDMKHPCFETNESARSFSLGQLRSVSTSTDFPVDNIKSRAEDTFCCTNITGCVLPIQSKTVGTTTDFTDVKQRYITEDRCTFPDTANLTISGHQNLRTLIEPQQNSVDLAPNTTLQILTGGQGVVSDIVTSLTPPVVENDGAVVQTSMKPPLSPYSVKKPRIHHASLGVDARHVLQTGVSGSTDGNGLSQTTKAQEKSHLEGNLQFKISPPFSGFHNSRQSLSSKASPNYTAEHNEIKVKAPCSVYTAKTINVSLVDGTDGKCVKLQVPPDDGQGSYEIVVEPDSGNDGLAVVVAENGRVHVSYQQAQTEKRTVEPGTSTVLQSVPEQSKDCDSESASSTASSSSDNSSVSAGDDLLCGRDLDQQKTCKSGHQHAGGSAAFTENNQSTMDVDHKVSVDNLIRNRLSAAFRKEWVPTHAHYRLVNVMSKDGKHLSLSQKGSRLETVDEVDSSATKSHPRASWQNSTKSERAKSDTVNNKIPEDKRHLRNDCLTMPQALAINSAHKKEQFELTAGNFRGDNRYAKIMTNTYSERKVDGNNRIYRKDSPLNTSVGRHGIPGAKPQETPPKEDSSSEDESSEPSEAEEDTDNEAACSHSTYVVPAEASTEGGGSDDSSVELNTSQDTDSDQDSVSPQSSVTGRQVPDTVKAAMTKQIPQSKPNPASPRIMCKPITSDSRKPAAQTETSTRKTMVTFKEPRDCDIFSVEDWSHKQKIVSHVQHPDPSSWSLQEPCRGDTSNREQQDNPSLSRIFPKRHRNDPSGDTLSQRYPPDRSSSTCHQKQLATSRRQETEEDGKTTQYSQLANGMNEESNLVKNSRLYQKPTLESACHQNTQEIHRGDSSMPNFHQDFSSARLGSYGLTQHTSSNQDSLNVHHFEAPSKESRMKENLEQFPNKANEWNPTSFVSMASEVSAQGVFDVAKRNRGVLKSYATLEQAYSLHTAQTSPYSDIMNVPPQSLNLSSGLPLGLWQQQQQQQHQHKQLSFACLERPHHDPDYTKPRNIQLQPAQLNPAAFREMPSWSSWASAKSNIHEEDISRYTTGEPIPGLWPGASEVPLRSSGRGTPAPERADSGYSELSTPTDNLCEWDRSIRVRLQERLNQAA